MSDQELLNSAKSALASLLIGSIASYTTPSGLSITRTNIAELRALIAELEGKVALAEISGGASRIEIGIGGSYVDGEGCR